MRDIKGVGEWASYNERLREKLSKLGDAPPDPQSLHNYNDILEFLDAKVLPALWREANLRFLKWFDKRGKDFRVETWLNMFNAMRLNVLLEHLMKRCLGVLGITGGLVVEYMIPGSKAAKIVRRYRGLNVVPKLKQLIAMYSGKPGIDERILRMIVVVAAKTTMLYYDKFFQVSLPKDLAARLSEALREGQRGDMQEVS